MQRRRNSDDADRLIVRYDGARKSVTITFQGQTHVLPETYPTHDDGMIAGYGFARAQGWQQSS
ncbi:MAG TPA: hypothetical protein VMB84_16360 [Stellaceae bacterium]|nr:hypothetical protein [Stellaceae bacterium]